MKKTLTFDLSSITVELEVKEGLKDEEIRELGEKALVKQLTKKLPPYRWGITEGTLMSDEDILCGRPVRLKDSGKVGIIYEIKPNTKFPVRLLVEGNKDIQCTKAALEKISKRTNIEKLIVGRQSYEKEMGEWFGVRSAFFVNGKDIIPVLVYLAGRGKIKAYIVGHESKGNYYSLSTNSLKRLFDTKAEAEEYVSK